MSKLVSNKVEGQYCVVGMYCVKDHYYGETKVVVMKKKSVSKLKMRPLDLAALTRSLQ